MATLAKVWKPLAQLVGDVQKAAKKYGFRVQINSGYRSSATQSELAREGSAYPAAPPGRSQHQYGLAVDLQAVPWAYQSTLVSWMQGAGAYWGGAGDPVHFQVISPQQWHLILNPPEAPPRPVTTTKKPQTFVPAAPAPAALTIAPSVTISADTVTGPPRQMTGEFELMNPMGLGLPYKPIWGYTLGYGTDAGGTWDGSLPPPGWKNPVATYVK